MVGERGMCRVWSGAGLQGAGLQGVWHSRAFLFGLRHMKLVFGLDRCVCAPFWCAESWRVVLC